jgi:thiol-disulfide isomerase/thioredoxin
VDGLRGRLVLLVFFKPDCPHCRASVPGLNALERDAFARGLRVVGASRDPRPAVEAFVRELGVAFPVALVDTEVLRDYDVSGFPSAFLVGPGGRIVWSGAPAAITADELDRRLAATPTWPALPATFDPLLAALRADRWGEAAAGFGVCSAPGACDAPTTAAAGAMLRWIDRAAADHLGAAEADLARGDAYEAWRTLDRLAGFGERRGPAARRAAEVLADPARARGGRGRASGRRDGLGRCPRRGIDVPASPPSTGHGRGRRGGGPRGAPREAPLTGSAARATAGPRVP